MLAEPLDDVSAGCGFERYVEKLGETNQRAARVNVNLDGSSYTHGEPMHHPVLVVCSSVGKSWLMSLTTHLNNRGLKSSCVSCPLVTGSPNMREQVPAKLTNFTSFDLTYKSPIKSSQRLRHWFGMLCICCKFSKT